MGSAEPISPSPRRNLWKSRKPNRPSTDTHTPPIGTGACCSTSEVVWLTNIDLPTKVSITFLKHLGCPWGKQKNLHFFILVTAQDVKMPSVDMAMARSLEPAAWEKLRNSLVRSVAHEMAQRDIIEGAKDKVTDIKTALSSWDNCMAASFCKYPVIAIMVVGGLILLAILTCIVRCACCAKSCCCSCFSCFKCCGNCCGCCDEPGSRKHKYLDEPYIPPSQGYRTEAPMPAFQPVIVPATTGVTGPPQYAEFDTKKPGGEDSLPQMPSWEGAGSRKVELEPESHEMNSLSKTPTTTTHEPKDPLMDGASPLGPTSPIPRESPQVPFGRGTPQPGRMMPTPAPRRDPYAHPNPYDTGADDGFGLDQPYDLPPAGMAAVPPAGRNSPGPGPRGYGRNRPEQGGFAEMPAGPGLGMAPVGAAPGYGPPRGPGPDSYGSKTGSPGPGYRGFPSAGGLDRGANASPAPFGGPNRGVNASPAPYGMDPRMRNSPGPRAPVDPYNRAARSTPGPALAGGPGGYSSPTQSPSRENFNRSYSPAPDRGYNQSPGPRGMNRGPTASPLAQQDDPPSSPIVNNSGFDFTSGFSRPHTADSQQYDRRPSESKELGGQEGYPGFKPYRPAQQGWTGV